MVVAASFALVALASCMVSSRDDDCDYVVTKCRTYCDTWCDAYGCYPACWDECWNECGIVSKKPAPTPADAGSDGNVQDASNPPDGGADAATTNATLCADCQSNADCQGGGLCLRTAGKAFCGRDCARAACPTGFSCSAFGSSKQCVPDNGACEGAADAGSDANDAAAD